MARNYEAAPKAPMHTMTMRAMAQRELYVLTLKERGAATTDDFRARNESGRHAKGEYRVEAERGHANRKEPSAFRIAMNPSPELKNN